MEKIDRFVGSLVGGALGDALGWPVEFSSYRSIVKQYGKGGIKSLTKKTYTNYSAKKAKSSTTSNDFWGDDYEYEQWWHNHGATVIPYGSSVTYEPTKSPVFKPDRYTKFEITDDTQMTMFTAEALLRWAAHGAIPERLNSEFHASYLHWLTTQHDWSTRARVMVDAIRNYPSALLDIDGMFASRAPGATCLSSLRATRELGTNAHNDSPGCGTIMRVAPVGLFFNSDPARAYFAGVDNAALTHGASDAQIAAGAGAMIVAHLVNGESKGVAVQQALNFLKDTLDGATDKREIVGIEKTIEALEDAIFEATTYPVPRILGSGFHAKDALAIAVYSLLNTDNFLDCIKMAVNHDGDSDTTGAIAGNFAGALYGIDGINKKWVTKVELTGEIKDLARNLFKASENASLSRDI